MTSIADTVTPAHSPAPTTSRRPVKAAGTPPAVILGGMANAVSVARSLGRIGAEVYTLNEPGAFVRHSRFARPIDVPLLGPNDEARAWADWLLGPDARPLHGAVLLSCSDAGIELIARHREALAERFLLDDSNPDAQLRMLGKLETYEAAEAAGVPTPRFRLARSRDDVEALCAALTFPLIVKPRLSHVFEGRTGRKLFVTHGRDELARAVEAVAATGTESLAVEMVPGPDDRLCSYYTYLDEQSRPLFDFTKRIIRRYPVLMGTACYHVTDHIPEAAELANRLFHHVGLRGLANVEFKRDERDGQLKLIECNARFTASNCLVARSGIDLAEFAYNRLTGRPLPPTDRFAAGLHLWDPVRDFQAYRALRREGVLTFGGWLASVARPQTFPYFEWTDPLPALARLSKPLRGLLANSWKKGA
jgi:predicted ATP-grasp superfamily ATP-dependent carboligase